VLDLGDTLARAGNPQLCRDANGRSLPIDGAAGRTQIEVPESFGPGRMGEAAERPDLVMAYLGDAVAGVGRLGHDAGRSRPKRLRYMCSMKSGSGAFQLSCRWFASEPSLRGFSPSSRAIFKCVAESR